MRALYSASTGAAVATVAGTAKTILGVLTPSQFGLDLVKFRIGLDSTQSTDKAALVELVAFDTDGTGTAVTVRQSGGRTIAAGFTAQRAYSVEPGTPTVLDEWSLSAQGGLLVLEVADPGYDIGPSDVLGIRVTSQTGSGSYNARASMHFGRC